ncbi:AAA family ATPase [Chitinophaga tropicalis]|uniref:AAA family ATPase n=1 Tax=Chitinophaga tropicalis TaxID=2683588 RepID=UPI0012F81AFC|nr:AAA family ATPase [Chitinophaga tropicalis]
MDLIKYIFCYLIPHLEDIDYRQEEKKIYYKERNVEVEGFRGWLIFNQLASGTRSIIAMIGDLICRIYSINPALEDPRNFSGIVLIDEIDVHLHPKLQKLFPSLLSECFPDIQFIATTHSVIPFLGAPLNSVFLKVSKTKGEGSVVTRLNLDIKNLLPNVLLTSSLFDMDSIAQVNSEGVQEIRTEDSYSEYLKNKELKKKLEDFEKGDRDLFVASVRKM